MTWFGNKTPTSAGEESITKEMKHSWVKSVPQRSLMTQWQEMLLRVAELFNENILYYPEKQEDMLIALEGVKTDWMMIDRQLASTDETAVMYDIINGTFPALVSRFTVIKASKNSQQRNPEDDFLSVQKQVEQMHMAVTKVRAAVDAQRFTRFRNLEHHEESKQLSALSFPEFAGLPEEVTTKLSVLQKIWVSQQETSHPIEDEYLLERIVTDYIPSSVGLYKPFIDDTMGLEATAREALIMQLGLIEANLKAVVNRNLQEQLKSLNAQTDFLTARLE